MWVKGQQGRHWQKEGIEGEGERLTLLSQKAIEFSSQWNRTW